MFLINQNTGKIMNNVNGSANAAQLKGKYKDLSVVLGQLSKAAGDGAYNLKQANLALEDSDERARTAANSFKEYAAAQKEALSSTSAFYDLQFELSNPEFQAKQKASADSLRPGGFSKKNLLASKEGTDFLKPFSGLIENQVSIGTNVQAPVSQTIALLKQSNEEVNKLGKNAKLSDDELKKVQLTLGDLSFAEDLGGYVETLSTNSKLGGANLKAVVSEALKLTPEDQKAFLDSIPTKKTRDLLEKTMKDLDGSVIMSIDPSYLTDLTDAVAAANQSGKLTLDFLGGAGVKAFGAKDAIMEFLSQAEPLITTLNEKFTEGKMNLNAYGTGVKGSERPCGYFS